MKHNYSVTVTIDDGGSTIHKSLSEIAVSGLIGLALSSEYGVPVLVDASKEALDFNPDTCEWIECPNCLDEWPWMTPIDPCPNCPTDLDCGGGFPRI